ncbi:unnamed protein product [Urochloa decumbens]|uniref:Uncharacterized protein n=1 Tax=Urochloa decumbens TaxID=240449 RepID=A0ABC9BT13_9POAL
MEDQQGPSSGDSHAVVVVDVPSLLAQTLEQELAGRRRLLGSQPCTPTIGLVPDLTRNVDEHEYNPHYISIGPYHWTRTTPNIGRDDDKLASLDTILSVARPGTTVEDYLRELARVEGDVRSFYAHSFDMTSAEFLRMLLLDSCFLINRFGNIVPESGSPIANGNVQGGNQQESSTAPAARGANKQEVVAVVRDVLYLAENQIPFFVVEKIHNLTFSSGSRVPVVKAKAGYISSILKKQKYSMATVVVDDPPLPEPGNLLHLLHMHFLKPTTVASSPTGQPQPVGRCRTATEYYINGVTFKCRAVSISTKEPHCILDIVFDRATATLVLPRLNIDAETWRILRNLMALEQLNPTVGSHVTAYCVFMSQLACTPSDVELLSRRGAIVHLLGNNDEVARSFSDLCKGVVFDADDPNCNYLRATCQELDRCYRSRPRRWMALLWQKYFASPWPAVGVMVAAVVLLCTMVQAVYAVLSYYNQGGAAK